MKKKCDGNHAGPHCGDPECWNDDVERGEDCGFVFSNYRSAEMAARFRAMMAHREIGIRAVRVYGKKKYAVALFSRRDPEFLRGEIEVVTEKVAREITTAKGDLWQCGDAGGISGEFARLSSREHTGVE